MNVAQSVWLVVAEMSHQPRKTYTLAVPEYSRKSGNPLIKAEVIAREPLLPACINKLPPDLVSHCCHRPA